MEGIFVKLLGCIILLLKKTNVPWAIVELFISIFVLFFILLSFYPSR